MAMPDAAVVKQYLLSLQANICAGLEALDGNAEFKAESWERTEGGGGTS